MIKNPQAIFNTISQGVYVISVTNGQDTNAFTAAWVMQVSFSPLMLCFSINPEHYSYKLLQEGKVCCISVLNNEQLAVAHHFGQSTADKMATHAWLETETGATALAESIAYFDCRVEHYTKAGDHKLVVCQVVDAAIINAGKPLLYADTAEMDNSDALY